MRQPVVPVIHAVNAAFQYFVTATELLRFLCRIVRCNQTQFPLTSAHEVGPKPTADWMLLIDCEVALTAAVFCKYRNGTQQHSSFQPVALDTTNLARCIIENFETILIERAGN